VALNIEEILLQDYRKAFAAFTDAGNISNNN
jgi:hypothetical protein